MQLHCMPPLHKHLTQVHCHNFLMLHHHAYTHAMMAMNC